MHLLISSHNINYAEKIITHLYLSLNDNIRLLSRRRDRPPSERDSSGCRDLVAALKATAIAGAIPVPESIIRITPNSLKHVVSIHFHALMCSYTCHLLFGKQKMHYPHHTIKPRIKR
ncbi:hypothetical protein Taro_026961 [Colocasia esculenta]|uniref:Uncharacterized protein n=1 Tax=Colocasia esculenta TaxID=4460 RepID=A0A843VIP6_COLES|nr:hypothetical protein [Colocasia esculenta]